MARKKAAKKKATKKKASKKKAGKRKSTRKAATKDVLLVASKVKNAIRSQGMNVASDAPGALNEVVYWYIDQAAKRASSNGRKTVRAHDFIAG